MTDVVIVNSGGANIASLQAALERLGCRAEVSTDSKRLATASHVILPGVGAAADAMQRLADAGLADTLRALRQPVLGICLGMQLLVERSEEDNAACLGIIEGTAERMPASTALPVPHMGWNSVRDVGTTSALLRDIDDGAYFYFVHSFAVPIGAATVAACDYVTAFSAVIERGNFFGTQFHPERSAAAGAQVLQNFLALSS